MDEGLGSWVFDSQGLRACWWLEKEPGQVSLSFQLLRAGRGLYEFGRTLHLLSTVTGLRIPPHNFIAANSVESVCYSHSLWFIILFFFFSCGRIPTNYSFHMGKHSQLFRTSVPSLLWLLPWGNSDKPRLQVSHVKGFSFKKLKSGFCRTFLRRKRVGWSLCALSALHRDLCSTCCPILEFYSAWRECSASCPSADQKDGKSSRLHRTKHRMM